MLLAFDIGYHMITLLVADLALLTLFLLASGVFNTVAGRKGYVAKPCLGLSQHGPAKYDWQTKHAQLLCGDRSTVRPGKSMSGQAFQAGM
jgi:hypothetical protein